MNLDEVKKNVAEIFDRFTRAEKEMHSDLAKVRSTCPHDWTYCVDPSGNRDSGWQCEACGLWSKVRPDNVQ